MSVIDDFFEPKKRGFKLIIGTYSRQTPYGYCYYKNHKGYLTKGLIEEHQCTTKQCRYFRKNEEHPYWIRKEKIRALKKAKKDGKSTYMFNGKKYMVLSKI